MPTYWRLPSRVDEFFTDCYTYFQHKGFFPLMIEKFVNILIFFFTVSFSMFLLVGVNWAGLWSCTTPADCAAVGIFPNWYSRYPWFQVIYWIIFGTYGLMKCFAWLALCFRHWKIRRWFHHFFDISEKDLRAMEWEQVVRRIAARFETEGPDGYLFEGHPLNEYDIVQRILRYDNYFVKFAANPKLLALPPSRQAPVGSSAAPPEARPAPSGDPLVPLLGTPGSPGGGGLSAAGYVRLAQDEVGMSGGGGGGGGLGRVAEEEDDDQDEEDDGEIVPDVRNATRVQTRLRRRFIVAGLTTMLLSPFIFLFTAANLLFRYVEVYKANPSDLGTRRWCRLADWQFRLYNELPHVFRKRFVFNIASALAAVLVLMSLVGGFLDKIQVPLPMCVSECLRLVLMGFLDKIPGPSA
ncbi:putative autophagy associated protein Atg9 [Paratrimastix pyriformis]|uniref:Autophagy-related protein 9 n=1 Tax=Paratrimastix pyriformis TaxID=342808 RepID=A0ABQ8U9N7_9EUKA|nr:putative autophagy associated protein Atg9 [Paratrimastix pyriformis]